MRCQLGLVVLCALLAALLRDVLVSRAGADEAAVRRADVERIVRALEAQSRATEKIATELRDAARACK